jgi:phosphoglycolate phosphatase-like HAD superfamily hydrolase
MIKLIAFDWNGTILADTSANIRANSLTLKKFKLKPISLNKFRDSFEIPVKNYWLKAGFTVKFFDNNFTQINETFHVNYEREAKNCRTRGGVKKILEWLYEQKTTSIIYSNHTILDINKHLKRLKIKRYFETILGRPEGDNSHIHNRGKADKLKGYVRQNKLKPHQVISVGDTEEEIEIGKQLGYHTVAIAEGWNSIKRLKKHHPDFLIHNMLELKKIVKQLNEM